MPRKRKTNRTTAYYRHIIKAGNRTVRIGAYPPKDGQETGVTLGIGYANPEEFAKIYFEITPEVWKEVNRHVKAALAAAEQKELIDAVEELGVKPPQKRRQSKPKQTAADKAATPDPELDDNPEEPTPKPKPTPAKPPTGTRRVAAAEATS